jgi:hypothetical protein
MKGDEMPAQPHGAGRLRRAATLTAALGLGAVLAVPGVGLAQTDETTTTTVVEDTSEETTDTTVADQTTTTDDPQMDRSGRGDPNCDHDEEASTSDA